MAPVALGPRLLVKAPQTSQQKGQRQAAQMRILGTRVLRAIKVERDIVSKLVSQRVSGLAG
jgi:hypothetical protein